MKTAFISLLFCLMIASCSDTKKQQVKEQEPGEKTSQAEKDSTGIFKWETELCENESTFDARRYSPEELAGTHKLWQMTGGILLEVNDAAFKPDQIAGLSTLKELDAEYAKKKKELLDLKIVNESYWIETKKLLAKAMKDEYDLSRIAIQAYTNPEILKGNRFSKVCPDLIKALTSSDTSLLMTSWKELVKEKCKTNGSPEYLMKRFEEEYNDPDRVMYARVELITFGWINRVNETITHVANDEKVNERFHNLFLKTKSECAEP
ncbi:MAG: hypothetical protein K0S23_417 [Fluviicola sp.]|jgi:hypothetical protein|uniref:hypothetical protein n=1 Tax=Fluviicola sp. TaxID=1917219 RepID=UPI0026163357|nr:hypothetical protein [Fluviicola sp.]MDF3026110.1 hypothetical protein [Fluviicola sp.]